MSLFIDFYKIPSMHRVHITKMILLLSKDYKHVIINIIDYTFHLFSILYLQ